VDLALAFLCRRRCDSHKHGRDFNLDLGAWKLTIRCVRVW
jgi:hypothetical protein